MYTCITDKRSPTTAGSASGSKMILFYPHVIHMFVFRVTYWWHWHRDTFITDCYSKRAPICRTVKMKLVNGREVGVRYARYDLKIKNNALTLFSPPSFKVPMSGWLCAHVVWYLCKRFMGRRWREGIMAHQSSSSFWF